MLHYRHNDAFSLNIFLLSNTLLYDCLICIINRRSNQRIQKTFSSRGIDYYSIIFSSSSPFAFLTDRSQTKIITDSLFKCQISVNVKLPLSFSFPSVLAPLLLLAVVSSSVDAQDFNEPEHRPQNRVKRMYAVCPPEFQRIGNECYFISREKETWMEAHFKCVDRDSKLAEPFKFEDKRLRKYLLAHGNQIGERSKRRQRRSLIN